MGLRELFGIKETGSWTAEEARNRVEFGGSHETLESAIYKEIKNIESSINGATFSEKRITSQIYSSSKREVTNGVIEHFKEKGFITDLYSNPEIPGYDILIIGW